MATELPKIPYNDAAEFLAWFHGGGFAEWQKVLREMVEEIAVIAANFPAPERT